MADETSAEALRALDELMHAAAAAGPDEVPALACAAAARLGFREVTVYLADMQQHRLVPLPLPPAPEPAALLIDDSIAGWTYRTTTMRTVVAEPTGLTLLLPLVDGTDRIGVLTLWRDHLDAPAIMFGRSLAALLTLILRSKDTHSDSYVRRQRRQRMSLSAEMVWAFLPPRTVRRPDVVSTAVLEPAYEAGGDGFDHSLIDDTLHLAILDAMGHDLLAGRTTSVAMAGCRNLRRNGAGLDELAAFVDRVVGEEFPDRYCTGVLGELDLLTGEFSWVNCGHPVPLLIRDQTLVPAALDRPAQTPLGMGALTGHRPVVHREQLRPRDRVLLYTDGVTEARSSSGELFGLENFTDFIIRATAAGEPAYEVLRRLIHAILAHHDQRLSDDATILLLEWRPGSEHPAVTPAL